MSRVPVAPSPEQETGSGIGVSLYMMSGCIAVVLSYGDPLTPSLFSPCTSLQSCLLSLVNLCSLLSNLWVMSAHANQQLYSIPPSPEAHPPALSHPIRGWSIPLDNCSSGYKPLRQHNLSIPFVHISPTQSHAFQTVQSLRSLTQAPLHPPHHRPRA